MQSPNQEIESASKDKGLSPGFDERNLLEELRVNDRERFLMSLFVPQEKRALFLALQLFDHELGRIPDRTTEPMAGFVRFQWWRDGLLGNATSAQQSHPVIAALRCGIEEGVFDKDELFELIDTRVADPNGNAFQSIDNVIRFAEATGGRLQFCALKLLGAASSEKLALASAIGRDYSVLKIARAMRAERLQGSDEMIPMLLDRIRDGHPGGFKVERTFLAAFLPSLIIKRTKFNQAGLVDPMPLLPLWMRWAHLLGRI
jgi:phytoene synthase